jgi:hypothetical protein
MSPARLKNGPPSGRRRPTIAAVLPARRVASAVVACSANSGVAPSTTTAITATRCGKVRAKSIYGAGAHGRSGEIKRRRDGVHREMARGIDGRDHAQQPRQ